ncbi:GAF domain-containing protein [uncultured Jatrophihabitans sp.]|uniref:GAF domain-containing protein n=1 Tax=uncultured Jatrophihabitans sp. TaxID=1610747 RepID=UPI0035CC38CC
MRNPSAVMGLTNTGWLPGDGWHPSLRARQAETLAQFVLGDPAAAQPLRALVREAAATTTAEHAQVCLVSTRQIVVVAEQGTLRRADGVIATVGDITSFEDAVCAAMARTGASVCIPDTRGDDRMSSLPAVAGGVVGAFLGSPLRTVEGLVVGALCVYDAGPHDWTHANQVCLDAIALGVGDALVGLERRVGHDR